MYDAFRWLIFFVRSLSDPKWYSKRVEYPYCRKGAKDLRKSIPKVFGLLCSMGCMEEADIVSTADGFFMVNKSIAELLAGKNIFEVPDETGESLLCSKFFDDWFLYAVSKESHCTYSLLKMREQEEDAKDGSPADGDTPGVTVSFIEFSWQRLTDCLEEPSDENRRNLNHEMNRVVAYQGQRHHKALKKYFKNPAAKGAYLVAGLYVRYIASFAKNGRLPVPECYKELVQQSISYKNTGKGARLPRFIDRLNQEAGRVICDHQAIYFETGEQPTAREGLAILATHTGNTSFYSFGAEVEYHAKFLTPLAKLKIPFLGRSVYACAIRADLTVGDPEWEGPAPFHREDSNIVKRQRALHSGDLDLVTFQRSEK